MKVYISGAISILDPEEAVANFQLIEDKLHKIGVTDIFNPLKEIDKDLLYPEQMRICIENLKTCDVLLQQNNWKLSAGAQVEFIEAQRAKLEIRRDFPGDFHDIELMVQGKYLKKVE
jgi:hypothetical protein